MLSVHDPAFTAVATTGTALGWAIGQAVEGGWSSDLVGTGGIIAAGVSVFLYGEKRRRTEQAEQAAMRRASDEQKDARIAALEERVQRMSDEHAVEVRALNERIIALLSSD